MIHNTDPFATPEPERSPVRRLRGRFATTVTLWTAPGPAGLTVSSTVIADGDPGRLLGLLDEESELYEAIERHGAFTVVPLAPAHQQLADRFAGRLPAPGGLFRQDAWHETETGPVPANAHTWVSCRRDAARPFGWGMLIEATMTQVTLGPAEPPLTYYRGGYGRLAER